MADRSIWRFEIPQELIEKHQYQPLTRRVKERVFGLNSAKVFGIDVKANRREDSRMTP